MGRTIIDDDIFENEYVHVDDLPNMNEMKTRLENLMSILYGEGDIEDTESELEELAVHLGLNLPEKPIAIERKAPHFKNKMQLVNALEKFHTGE